MLIMPNSIYAYYLDKIGKHRYHLHIQVLVLA